MAHLAYTGINLAVGCMTPLPGVYNNDYRYPSTADCDYFVTQKGMNCIRLAFRWERFQTTLGAALSTTELGRFDPIVNYLTSLGSYVILNAHNYGRWNNAIVGDAAHPTVDEFGDFWGRMAAHYASNSKIIYGLMNEPHDQGHTTWVDACNHAIVAIRANAGTSQLILVPGNGWSSAEWWTDGSEQNAVHMLDVTDSGNNMAFECHNYLDTDGDGTETLCVTSTEGVDRLSNVTTWLHDNNRKGFLGEFGTGNNTTCNSAVTGMLAHMEANSDHWLGWSWWVGGVWWEGTIYCLNAVGGVDDPRMAWLTPYLSHEVTPPTGTGEFGDVLTNLTIPAGYSIRRNLADTDFEAFQPTTTDSHTVTQEDLPHPPVSYYDGSITVYNALGITKNTADIDRRASGAVVLNLLTSATNASYNSYGLIGNVEVASTNANNFLSLRGVQGASDHCGSGTVDASKGGYFLSDIKYAGTITSAEGVRGEITGEGTGHYGTAYGVRGYINLASGMHVTGTAHGVHVKFEAVGTIENANGIYIEAVHGTLKHAINVVDASDNYFAGKVGIGAEPTRPLTVNGALNSATFPYNVAARDNQATAINVGGGIGFEGNDGGSATRCFGIIQGAKENATSSNYACCLRFFTRTNGNEPHLAATLTSASNLNLVGGLGVNGVSAPAQAAHIANATNATDVITRANAILVVLEDLGFVATS